MRGSYESGLTKFMPYQDIETSTALYERMTEELGQEHWDEHREVLRTHLREFARMDYNSMSATFARE